METHCPCPHRRVDRRKTLSGGWSYRFSFRTNTSIALHTRCTHVDLSLHHICETKIKVPRGESSCVIRSMVTFFNTAQTTRATIEVPSTFRLEWFPNDGAPKPKIVRNTTFLSQVSRRSPKPWDFPPGSIFISLQIGFWERS